MRQDQDIDRAKIIQLEVQVSNIPKNLKEYEHKLCLLIKESANKMEQVNSSLCAVAAGLGKKNNKEIMFLGGTSKRTRQSSRKKVAKDTVGTGISSADMVQNTTEAGKEVVKMIKELQQLLVVVLVSGLCFGFFCWFLKPFV